MKHLGSLYGARLLAVQADCWATTRAAQEIFGLAPGFDCFIVNRVTKFDGDSSVLLQAITSRAGKWVEALGNAAEEVHDAIDATSVRIGRQSAIGEGDPLTTWHDDMSDSDIASYVLTGGPGSSDTKVVVIVAPDIVAERLIRKLSKSRRVGRRRPSSPRTR